MIELRVPAARTTTDIDAERRLTDLLVAHTVTVVEHEPPHAELPVIVEGSRTITASDFESFLDDLSRDVAAWRRYQTDACYVDDDGSVC